MLTGIGAPTAWPFFQRGAAALGPARTALGGVFGLPAPDLTLAGINLAVGDLLLVGTASDTAFLATAVVVDVDGNVLTVDNSLIAGAMTLGTMQSWLVTAAIVGGTITATWNGGGPAVGAFLACKVTNLTGALQETLAVDYAAPGALHPDSGLTAYYGPVPRIGWGLVALSGKVTDTLGTWQPSSGLTKMNAGQRFGGPGPGLSVDLKEGYRVNSSGVGEQAHIHGQTQRECVAIVGYYH